MSPLRVIPPLLVFLLAHATLSQGLPQNQERCYKEPDIGPCFGFLQHYAYNSATRVCEEFIYGGCLGNDNNFESKEECQRECGSYTNIRSGTGRVVAACKDGSSWPQDCNTCYCNDGKVHCTEIACGTVPRVPSRFRVRRATQQPQQQQQQEAGEECDAGAKFRRDCNWCSCRHGLAACTKMRCRPGYNETAEPECEGTARWKKDCNWCNCVDGRGICTARACFDSERFPHLPGATAEREEEVCTEGSRWRQSCNWCSCNNGRASCTLRGCLPDFESSEPECEGTSRWKDDCNWCDCVNGRGVCTTIACHWHYPETVTTHTQEEGECSEGSRWRRSCNWCTCRNGLGTCTKKGCRPNFESSEPECEGTSRWKDDCNWCDCVNGRGICTSNSCLQRPESPTVTVEEEEEDTCTAGSAWRDECNWCHCLRGHGSCTLKGCPPDLQSDEPECEGESHWKHDCNWCRCLNGIAVCSKMLCPNAGQDVCKEGSTWRSDCNLCRCVRGVELCTKKDCPTPSLPAHCSLPATQRSSISCTAFFRKWTFQQSVLSVGRCQEIVYGGCGATLNLYDTQEECEIACPAPTLAISSTRTSALHQNRDRCYKDQDPGPCFGHFTRYAYNSATGACEEFLYGGCQGNDNNFESEEECRRKCGSSANARSEARQGQVYLPAAVCVRRSCPWRHWGHYLAQQCLPQYLGDACCPSAFMCPPNEPSDPSQCHYQGRGYGRGESVPVDNRCSADCRCSQSFQPGNNLSEVRCADIECPSLFRPPQPNCRLLYRLGECCSYSEECVDPNTSVLEPRSATCVYKNQTYQEGDLMYFDDHPCRQCVCSPGFTDPLGPGCSEVDCGWDFRFASRYAQGCTPIFFEDNCCPIDWLCAGDGRIESTAINQVQTTGAGSEVAACVLGDLRVVVGATVGITDCKLTCRCLTPPGLTCLQYRSCEAAAEQVIACEVPPECPSWCHITTDSSTGCPTCSCVRPTFTCPLVICPANCTQELDLETGCQSCKCNCHYDIFGLPPCPADCAVQMTVDSTTGCEICECIPPTDRTELVQPDHCPLDHSGRAPCPMDCGIIRYIDKETGCEVCECDPNDTSTPWDYLPPFPPSTDNCPKDHMGRAPCPMDCAVIRSTDEETGCEVCKCDPNNPGNPFGPPFQRQNNNCPKDHMGRAPCPMDCAVIRSTDEETGCEVCKCDPNNPGSPFGPPFPRPDPSCPKDHNGQAPCPMDCGIIRYINEETGCEVCECDPNDTSTPWDPLPPLPPSTDNCPKDHMGRAPCPMDCAVIRSTDEETGCEVCKCDPNNPGNPFGPPFPKPAPSCPKDHNGRAPCPMDCAIIRSFDRETGCEVCKCDPNNPGNPFGFRLRRHASCRKDHTGRAPCPMDCGIIRYFDWRTGCEVCKCDPNNPGNPFGPTFPRPASSCPKDHNGRAPCPLDCAIIRSFDRETGCEVCKCDPNNPGNPFGPPFPRPTPSCQKDHNGRAPCPLDCGIIRYNDPKTGCEVCECDPNDTSTPWDPIPPLPPSTNNCLKDHSGRAPCPLDCGIIRYTDQKTGCEVCECDPNDTGNPFFN